MKRDWKAAREKVNDEACCRVCQRGTQYLDPAHIIPRSLGGGQHSDSIVPLCQGCHRLYDDLQFDLLPYLTHEEQAEAVRVVGIERARMRLAPQSYGKAAV